MNLKEILKTAALGGTIMLVNGGETYRVEEVINKICTAHGVEVNCYATLTGIMVSGELDGEQESSTIRIQHRTMNLDIIHKVNDISRRADEYQISHLYRELKSISKEPKHSASKKIIAYALAGASFTLLFGGNALEFFASAFIGVVLYFYSSFMNRYEVNSFFINCIGSSILSICTIIFYKLGIIPAVGETISGTIMLLVPGMALTNAVRDLIAEDYMAGIARGVEALLIATSLAAGSGVVLAVLL